MHEKMDACTHFKENVDNETTTKKQSKQESANNNELRSATGKQITGYRHESPLIFVPLIDRFVVVGCELLF